MHYLIYKITNRLNNKIYVGKHKTERIDDGYLGSGILIGRAVETYGKENFIKEILFECSSEEEMNKKEADIVDLEFISRDDTYNLSIGGVGGWEYINSLGLNETHLSNRETSFYSMMGSIGSSNLHNRRRDDTEFAEAIREKQRIKSILYYQSNSHPWTGRRHSIESREKMRERKRGMYIGDSNPSYGTIWITNGDTSIKIKKTEEIPIGWRRGRK